MNIISTATAYGLACGGIQQADNGAITVTLWQEHGMYQVRAHAWGVGRLYWEGFNSLTEARANFRALCKLATLERA